MLNCLFVFLGGGLGALSRYGISNLGWFDHDKYIYTLAINLSGCLIIGILWAVFRHNNVSQYWYLFALTGFLGGYTTYSAFSLDAMQLFEQHRFTEVGWYIATTYIGGLLMCAIGLFGTYKLLKM